MNNPLTLIDWISFVIFIVVWSVLMLWGINEYNSQCYPSSAFGIGFFGAVLVIPAGLIAKFINGSLI
jgi:hypothetical protein